MSHVLLIVVDALRADHLGCYGAKAATPNIDRLAHEGVRFSNAISQSSWTRPAMASLLTGRYPSEHGLVDRVSRTESQVVRGLDPSVPTLAELLEAGGCATAAFMAGNGNLKPVFGLTKGFADSSWHPTNEGAAIVEDFERWLDTERPDRTFSYVHFMDVHNPLPVEIIPSRLDRGLDLDFVRETREELVTHYAASVRKVDEHIGRLLRALGSSAGLARTWVIVTADHGEELLDHGSMLAHGRTLYRELVRVPLVVRAPAGVAHTSVVAEPVQLIDLAPTILDCLDGGHAEMPGWSLLPLVRGDSAAGAAFSELVRNARYSRSVTTGTHQLIESFALEELPVASLDDLQPGISVEVKGQLVEGGHFLATKVSLKRAGRHCVVRGAIEKIEPASCHLHVMGVQFRTGDETQLAGFDDEPISLDELSRGDRVSVEFPPDSTRPLLARAIRRRKPGGKSKLAGTIDRIERHPAGVRSFELLGINVVVPESTRITPVRAAETRGTRMDALPRILAGDFVAVERELYDLRDDPLETRNVVDTQPDVLRDLQARLATWTQSLNIRSHEAAQTVDVDPETMEQLRLMGYVE
jgi:Sulfatase/Domain of unknown function (DUF5666)